MNIPTLPDTDQELFALMKRDLFTAVVGDVLDAAGYTRQFLPPEIRALHPDMVVAGWAMPILEADCFTEEVVVDAKKSPFGIMFRALDDLKPEEVYICTGSSFDYALWGELMSTRAMHLGAAGAVVDGYSRDTRGILKLGFPTFSRGTSVVQLHSPMGSVCIRGMFCSVTLMGLWSFLSNIFAILCKPHWKRFSEKIGSPKQSEVGCPRSRHGIPMGSCEPYEWKTAFLCRSEQ